MNKTNLFKTLILFLLLVPFFISAQELLKMPKPTHTVKGVPTCTLEVIKEIEVDFDEDLFFAIPWQMSVNKSGWIYVYDVKLIRVFIFDDKFQYVGQFLEKGQAPGEVDAASPANIKIHAAGDGNLYVSDAISDRLLKFSHTGKFLNGKRMNRRDNRITAFTPISDKKGFFYAYSMNNGIVDKLDSEMKCIHTYLDMKRNEKFVIYKPSFKKYKEFPPIANLWKEPGDGNTFYALTSDDQLLIYLFRSSTAFLYKGKKLERKFEILIDRVLPLFRKSAEENKIRENRKTYKRKGVRRNHMFLSCFVDGDEPYFYLNFYEGGGFSIFKFDLKGNLVRIIKTNHAFVRAKINGLFYGFSIPDRNPIILKEK